MRVLVRHGHFAFYPQFRGDVLHFQRIFGTQLYQEDDYYTFLQLTGLPRWSQFGRLFGTLPALITYEGRHPWEVMAENDFVYSLETNLLVPSATFLAETISLPQARDFAIAPKPLIQPGSTLLGLVPNQILGYEGYLDIDLRRLYISSLETLL